MIRGERAALEVQHVRVEYGRRVAVDDVSFSVFPGEIFGLLGPNGAGKTSTLGVIEGLLTPRHGRVYVLGIDVRVDRLQTRANLGIQLQATSFQQDLTVIEIVRLFSGLYGVALDASRARTVIARIGLADRAGKKAKQLSGGEQQRLSLAIAVLHEPPIVLLDEPTSGLDPQSRRHLWAQIEAMRDAGCAILLTTHAMDEADAICNRVAIIDRGRIVATDTPAQLVRSYRDDPDVRAAMRGGEPTLEDVFIGVTGAAGR